MKNSKFKISIKNSKIRKTFAFLLLFLLFYFYFCFFTLQAYAHVLATDKNIGAVLHINPEDDPIAGKESSFYFEFKDKEGKFQPINCDCLFSVLANGKELYTQPLFQSNTDPDLKNASVAFRFPKRNVYQIKVSGKPLTPGAFQPFILIYDIRVDRESEQEAGTTTNTDNWFVSHISHIAIGGLALGAFLFLLFRQKKNKKMMKGGEKHNEKNNNNTY